MFLTSVADHAHGWRGEDEDASAEEGQFPQHHDLLPKEADELGHTACRVGDLFTHRDGYNNTLIFQVTLADTTVEEEMSLLPSSQGACCG